MRLELKARPLVFLLAGLLIGLSFPTLSWIFSIGVVLGFIIKKQWVTILSVGGFAAGFLLTSHAPPTVLNPGEFNGRITIRSFPTFLKGKAQYAFVTDESSPQTGVLKVDPTTVLSPFSTLDVRGTVNPSKTGTFYPTEYRVVSSSPLFDFLVRSQLKAIEATNQLYGKEDGAWVTALTFNFPSDLSTEEKQDLRFNGTYHLVSASGMHVWVIALILHFLLVQMGVPRHWQLGIVFLLLLMYCGITGFHAPTLRASLMWLIGSAAYLFRRSPDGLSALCLSALIWLFFVPSDAFTAGFQLSYVVSGCLLLWFERRQKEESSEFRTSFEAALVATLAAEPLCAWWFGRIILIGPISNLLIGIASSAVMILGFLSLIPGVGTVCMYVAKPLIWWMKIATDYTANFPYMAVKMHAMPPWVYVIYYSVLLLILLGRRATFSDPLKNE